MKFISQKSAFPFTTACMFFLIFLFNYSLVTYFSLYPRYLSGLLFLIPFMIFFIIYILAQFTKADPIALNVLNAVLIAVLGGAMFFSLLFLSFDEATTPTNDLNKYTRVLRLNNYRINESINHFPAKIPTNAEDVEFSYVMPFLQGGEKLILKYRSDMSEINEAIAELEKKSEWIGIPSDKEAEDHGISFGSLEYDGGYMLPDDFTIYVIESKPYKSDDWNHGYTYGAAVSVKRNEIYYFSKKW